MEDATHLPIQLQDLGFGFLFEKTQDALVVFHGETGRIRLLNPAATALFALSASEATAHSVEALVPLVRSGELGCSKEMAAKRFSGEEIIVDLTLHPISADADLLLAIVKDVSDYRKAKDTLHHLALFDHLTALPNRLLFQDRLSQALAQANRHNWLVGVVFFGLDRFKLINDTLGHDKGDHLLKLLAIRLGECLRETDTLARFGGDEFVIILTGNARAEDIIAVAEKIQAATAPAFVLDDKEHFITGCMGISISPLDGEDVTTLIKHADTALTHAKTHLNDSKRFTPAMNHQVKERLGLKNGLHRALERGEFLLHYQPQVALSSGTVVGAEALIRWAHPELGLIAPSKFIPIAEETGLIAPIAEWVLRAVCEQNRAWMNQGLQPIRLAVNLSGRNFRQKNLQAVIAKTLESTGVPASMLEIEITENVLMENMESVAEMLQQLSALGARIALDDFGTGYSSLQYLRRFPLHTLKIDQTFVQGLETDANDQAIVRAIVALAHSMGLSVIAEGVETKGQLEFLRAEGCDEIQGFYFSRPLSAKALTEVLLAGSSLPLLVR
jgi:diguanylate cyclase (GGDEF)-like protein